MDDKNLIHLTDVRPQQKCQTKLDAADLADKFLCDKRFRVGNELYLYHWKNDFYLYNGKCFDKLSKDYFCAIVVNWLQTNAELRVHAKTYMVNNILLNIEASVKINDDKCPPIWFSDMQTGDANYINMQNGIFDVGYALNGEATCIWPHSPIYFSTVCLPYAYDPNANCPVWHSFLERVLPNREVRELIQEWFGYNLVFDTTQQKFALFVGEGANGKTVACVVLRALLGQANVSAIGLESLSSTRTFPLASTVGKLANVVEELNDVDKAAEGELKKFVSGGLFTAERKNRDPFEFRPTARLTFATNVLPRFSDRSDGIWRRLLLIPFTVQIKNEWEQDKRLIDQKFWEKSGELPGIFNWALQGLIRLNERGHFSEPLICVDAKAQFKKDANPAKTFLLDSCDVKEGNFVLSSTLYEKYKNYMHENGLCPLSGPLFSKEISRVFPNAQKTKNAVYYQGGRGHGWYHIHLIS